MKKMLLVTLAILMLLSTATTAAAEEMPVITILMGCDAEIPTEDAQIVQALREATGVDIQPLYVNTADRESRLSAYIASGDLPDIFQCSSATATELISYGALLDMSPYMEEYGQNILADGEARLQFGINSDGAIYGLPHNMSYPWCMAVRRDWMQNLGYEVGDEYVIEMPIDEFKQLMYDFTYGDPDGDGVDDTFGLCMEDSSPGMVAPIFTAYGIPLSGYGSLYYDTEEDVCKSIAKHPNFLEAMETLRYFYQNGCMDTEFAVVADASTEFQYLWNGTAGAASWSPAGMTNNWLARYTEEDVDENSFVYINITDNNGENGGYVVSYNGSWVCVSAASEHPEAAIHYMDYLYTEEGGALAYAGIEGVHYQWTDKDAYQFEYINEFTDISKQRADGGWLFWNQVHPDDNFELKTLTPITSAAVLYAKEHQMDNAVIYYGVPEIALELGSTHTDVIMEMICNMIVAEGDITEMYNSYIAEYDSVGGLTLEEQATEIWKAENGIA